MKQTFANICKHFRFVGVVRRLFLVDIYVGIVQYNHIVKAYMIQTSLHYEKKIRVVDKRIGIIRPKYKEN